MDIDNDRDLDFFINGATYDGTKHSSFYLNQGNDSFVELSDVSLTGVSGKSSIAADFNNDGFSDLFLAGTDSDQKKVATFLFNNGDLSFSTQGLDISSLAYLSYSAS